MNEGIIRILGVGPEGCVAKKNPCSPTFSPSSHAYSQCLDQHNLRNSEIESSFKSKFDPEKNDEDEISRSEILRLSNLRMRKCEDSMPPVRAFDRAHVYEGKYVCE